MPPRLGLAHVGQVRPQVAAAAGYGLVEESLMPGGLEAGLTVEDQRDLIAFLAARPGAAENEKQLVRTGEPAPGSR